MELLKLNRLILLEANGELESNGPIELTKLAYFEARRSQVDQQEVPKYVRYKAKCLHQNLEGESQGPRSSQS